MIRINFLLEKHELLYERLYIENFQYWKIKGGFHVFFQPKTAREQSKYILNKQHIIAANEKSLLEDKTH